MRKAEELVQDLTRGGLGRRELVRRLGALGLTAAAADVLVNSVASRALAADWPPSHRRTSG